MATAHRPGTLRSMVCRHLPSLKGKRLLPFADEFDNAGLHVREPFVVILLCGGPTGNLNDPIPKSLRDAFLKIIEFPALKNADLIQAEEVTSQFDFFDHYTDILIFETDLAQIVELIILFCESEGSVSELAAFAFIQEIYERLFVIVRENDWNQKSFIKLGPLRRIELKVGRDAIHVIADGDIGLRNRDASAVDKNALRDLLDSPLQVRLSKPREPTTFDPSRPGHVIKLIVGLIQEYGALTGPEIMGLLTRFDVHSSPESVRGYLLCAQAVRWIKSVSRGSHDYFVHTGRGEDAATFRMKEGAREKNKMRRRLAIREHWKSVDAARHSAIRVGAGRL
ncbi:MAG: hypothetical protein H6872_03485 [Methylobacteriaceae bacterium]|nr:hypothetical protein [Methylobacteriaceae bacterium]